MRFFLFDFYFGCICAWVVAGPEDNLVSRQASQSLPSAIRFVGTLGESVYFYQIKPGLDLGILHSKVGYRRKLYCGEMLLLFGVVGSQHLCCKDWKSLEINLMAISLSLDLPSRGFFSRRNSVHSTHHTANINNAPTQSM